MYELHGFELVVDMWLVLARVVAVVVVVVMRVVASVGFTFLVLAAIHTLWLFILSMADRKYKLDKNNRTQTMSNKGLMSSDTVLFCFQTIAMEASRWMIM